MNWQPIETYDAMKKKPKLAAFYFKGEGTLRKATRGRTPFKLEPAVALSRVFGLRTCTHWCPLPDTGELDKAFLGSAT
jgi:hypothetical protein